MMLWKRCNGRNENEDERFQLSVIYTDTCDLDRLHTVTTSIYEIEEYLSLDWIAWQFRLCTAVKVVACQRLPERSRG